MKGCGELRVNDALFKEMTMNKFVHLIGHVGETKMCVFETWNVGFFSSKLSENVHIMTQFMIASSILY